MNYNQLKISTEFYSKYKIIVPLRPENIELK
jgi:hypothetical protein